MGLYKLAALLLAAVAVSSVWAIVPASGADSKPAIPQFSISTNEKDQMVLTIWNQPFISYYDSEVNQSISLYYQVRAKTSSVDEWTNIEVFDEGYTNGFWQKRPYQTQNSGLSTVLIFNNDEYQGVQVQALIGYYTSYNSHSMDFFDALATFTFHGQGSGWSGTHTVEGKILALTPTPNSASTQPPSAPPPQPSFVTQDPLGDFVRSVDWQTIALASMALAIAFLATGLAVLWRKVSKQNTANANPQPPPPST